MTRRLECENRYDEGAWDDHHWKDTLSKRTEITDTTNHSSPIVSKGDDDIVTKKTLTSTINSTLSESKLGLDGGLQAVDQCKDLIDEESKYYGQTLENSETNNSR